MSRDPAIDLRPDAMLLIGPTGAGKTPLGDSLARSGFARRRCVHFDFGANLRQAAAGELAGLPAADLAVIRRVLETGALLEDHQFPIARRLLEAFLRERAVTAGDWVVLNGLPRHGGQAAGVAAVVRVRRVVHLICPADVVYARIAADSGGDRAGRLDDAPAAVRRKLALFEARTAPLLDFYAKKGVRIDRVPVTVATEPETIVRQLTHGNQS